MPRLSDERRARRRREIMEAAWRCFATNGFHATSMDDVIAASGTSASGVYRYVSGKDELIAGAGEESTRLLRTRLREMAVAEPAPTPSEVVDALLGGARDARTSHFSLLAIQAWAEALRSPEIAGVVAAFHLELRALLEALAARWAAAGLLGPGADPGAVGYALALLVPGLIVTEHLVDRVDTGRLAVALTGTPTSSHRGSAR